MNFVQSCRLYFVSDEFLGETYGLGNGVHREIFVLKVWTWRIAVVSYILASLFEIPILHLKKRFFFINFKHFNIYFHPDRPLSQTQPVGRPT